MTDEPLSSPPRVPVTAEFLAEAQRKQVAYAESRRQHRERLERSAWGNEDEESAPATSPTGFAEAPKTRRRGRIIDPRQLKLEL